LSTTAAEPFRIAFVARAAALCRGAPYVIVAVAAVATLNAGLAGVGFAAPVDAPLKVTDRLITRTASRLWFWGFRLAGTIRADFVRLAAVAAAHRLIFGASAQIDDSEDDEDDGDDGRDRHQRYEEVAFVHLEL
jgi:hypothetical protein